MHREGTRPELNHPAYQRNCTHIYREAIASSDRLRGFFVRTGRGQPKNPQTKTPNPCFVGLGASKSARAQEAKTVCADYKPAL